MGKFKYNCVSCGEEVKEEEMLVSLSQFVLDGATNFIIEQNPLYVTRKELGELLSITETVEWSDKPLNVITIEQLCRIAYQEVNRSKLNAPAKNADEAYKTYLETYQRAKEIKAGIIEEEKPQKDENGAVFSFFNDDTDNQVSEDKSDWDTVSIPGFSHEQVVQLCENFPDGTCHCKLKLRDGFGYSYQIINEKSKKYKGITESFYCPHCKKEIMDCAFDKRQILIGMVGFQKVGKTCLIYAMCNHLMNEGGTLNIPCPADNAKFAKEFSAYRIGYKLEKSDYILGGNNLINPSVLLDDVIWTFVDIPGEAICDTDDQGTDVKDSSKENPTIGQFAIKALVKNAKFAAVLHCDAYIMCTDKAWLDEPIFRGQTANIFRKFLEYATGSENDDRSFPVLLTMTKVDQPMECPRPKREDDIPYNRSQYLYWKEYGGMMKEGLGKILDSVIGLSYVTPISSSAYGFKPYDYDYRFDPENPTQSLDLKTGEVYRRPEPKNMDLITEWVKKVTGLAPNVTFEGGSTATVAFDVYDHKAAHWDDNQCLAIAQNFCNPSEWDIQWLETVGGGALVRRIKQRSIMRKYQKQFGKNGIKESKADNSEKQPAKADD